MAEPSEEGIDDVNDNRPTPLVGEVATRTTLYRVFGAAGELLYVGISKHALARFHEHSKGKEWWPLTERIAVEHFDDRASALEAEARVIRSECPQFNIVHAVKAKPAHSLTVGESRRIDWRCSECGEPVQDGDGWISVSLVDAFEHLRAWANYKHEKGDELFLDFEALFALPEAAKWRVFHRGCDPDPNEGSYWFDIERCRTEAHLIHWTAHIMGKPWHRSTDWAKFIEARGKYA